ncbi:hypothetical protein SAMN05216557_101964 [Sphingomonas carotinifaciens]|uniref:Uncharacterized protein n=1 Tax=Sphingomonas carotinifaciens TaxID=1166323 RepID=A0A1G7GNP0_9SPHN|nr:hypothetical protein SAMN05216557_101964 [Sphingomonas carotinifaciens]
MTITRSLLIGFAAFSTTVLLIAGQTQLMIG